jgi:hypothetical protein
MSSYEDSKLSKKSLGSFFLEVTAKPCSCGEILIEARDKILPAFTALNSPNGWSILSSGAMGETLHLHSMLFRLPHASVFSSPNQASSIILYGDRYVQLSKNLTL